MKVLLSLFLVAASLVAAAVDNNEPKDDEARLRGSPKNSQQRKLKKEDPFDPRHVKVLVKFNNEVGSKMAKSKASKVRYESNRFKIIAMEVDSEDILGLENDPNLDYVDLDQQVFAILPVEEDEGDGTKKPKRRRLAEETPWGISRVQGDQLLPGAFSNQVKACIVDTGFDPNHEDLPGTDTVAGDDSSVYPNGENLWSSDGHGHGTHCAGTVAAVGGNGKGVVGVVPNANATGITLHIGKGLDDDGSGSIGGLIEAVDSCIDAQSNIISLSLGGYGYSSAFKDTLDNAYMNENVLIVAAAGNDDSSSYMYPASYPSVMSVAATDSSNGKASFSNYNDQVEISAPGVAIKSTLPGNKYASWSGTSMATPHVAGVAALLWSHNITCEARQIRRLMLASTVRLPLNSGCNVEFGHGLVQAKAAYDLMIAGGCEAADGLLDTDGLSTSGGCSSNSPTAAPTPSPTPAPTFFSCPDGKEIVTLDLYTDNYPGETTFELKNAANEIISSGGPYNDQLTHKVENMCVDRGVSYFFTLYDSYGDGICCSYGSGNYTVTCGADEVIQRDGAFASYDTNEFFAPFSSSEEPSSAPSGSTAPSSEPSNSPTQSPQPSSTPSTEPSLSMHPTEPRTSSPSASPAPSKEPSMHPSPLPSSYPTWSLEPSKSPTNSPTDSAAPSQEPSNVPSVSPSNVPSVAPTSSPTSSFQGRAWWIQCRDKECKLKVKNDELILFTVVEMSIAWPESSPGYLPELREVKKGGDKLWKGTSTAQPTVISSWDKSVSVRELDAGETKEFKFKFEKGADLVEDETQYTASVTLQNSQSGVIVSIPVEV